jgi:hypothetical protein
LKIIKNYCIIGWIVRFLLNIKSHLPLSPSADGREIVCGSTKTTGKAIIFNSTKVFNLLKINQLRSEILVSPFEGGLRGMTI